jgi:hypothetical protein
MNADIVPNADTAALQRDLEQQRLANQGLEAEVARLAAAAAASGAASAADASAADTSNPKPADEGGGSVELELLRHELEDLRHDNAEMESGFHEAAAQVGSLFSC